MKKNIFLIMLLCVLIICLSACGDSIIPSKTNSYDQPKVLESETNEQPKVFVPETDETESELKELMFGGIGNLGLGFLVYTIPDSEDEDYRLYFFNLEKEEDRYQGFEELSYNLSDAAYVFPNVREGNVSIGEFKKIYFMDYTGDLKDGVCDVIVIAVYEKDGIKYYDTRVYEEREKGFVVDEELTQELNVKYYNVENYPVGDIVTFPGEPNDYIDKELESLMTLFYTAYFNKDIDTIKQYLAKDYQGDVSFISEVNSMEEIDILEIKGGESTINLGNIGDECNLSLELIFPNEDTRSYMTVKFVKEEAGWKVQWFGFE